MLKIFVALFVFVLAGCAPGPVRYVVVDRTPIGKLCDVSGYNCRDVYATPIETSVPPASVSTPAVTQVWMGQGYYYQPPNIAVPCCLPRKGDKWYRW